MAKLIDSAAVEKTVGRLPSDDRLYARVGATLFVANLPKSPTLISSGHALVPQRRLRTKPSTPGRRLRVHPKVTVVIPTFNRAQYLAEAIQSVLNQTVADCELIVVDDGSTDETSAVLASFRDPRLRLFRKEHRGISAAMNAGLRAARGEYIARLDSDDVWFADLLEQETAVLDSYPDVGVVYARAQAMSANGTPREHYVGLPLRYPDDMLLSLAGGGMLLATLPPSHVACASIRLGRMTKPFVRMRTGICGSGWLETTGLFF